MHFGNFGGCGVEPLDKLNYRANGKKLQPVHQEQQPPALHWLHYVCQPGQYSI